MLPTVVIATTLFALALWQVDRATSGEACLLAAAGGGLGAALGGLVKLRDEIVRGAQVREFSAFYLAQLAVGAAVGLFTLALIRSDIVDLGPNPGDIAAISVAVGYSEALFVGLVARIASVTGGAGQAAEKTDPSAQR